MKNEKKVEKEPKKLLKLKKEGEELKIKKRSVAEIQIRYKKLIIVLGIIAIICIAQTVAIITLAVLNVAYLNDRNAAVENLSVYKTRLDQIDENTDNNLYFMRNIDYNVNFGSKSCKMLIKYTYSTYFEFKLNKSHAFERTINEQVVKDLEAFCDANSVSKTAESIKLSCINSSIDEEVIDAILDFVQDKGDFAASIHDIEPFDDFPRYPVETICEGNGDVEDKSILLVSMLESLGFQTLLVLIPNHCYAAVKMDSAPIHSSTGNSINIIYNNSNYYACETSVSGYRIGDLPTAFQNEPYWVAEVIC